MGGFTSVAERAIRRMTKEATGRCIIVMIDFLDEQNKTSDEAFFRRVFVHKGHLFASCMMTLLPFSSLLTFLPLQTSHYCFMRLPPFLTRNRVYIHDSLCFFLSAEKIKLSKCQSNCQYVNQIFKTSIKISNCHNIKCHVLSECVD